jgi:hypothetical protein
MFRWLQRCKEGGRPPATHCPLKAKELRLGGRNASDLGEIFEEK